jgi:putative membrane protein
MIIAKHILISKVISKTWLSLLLLILACTAAYFFDIYFLKKYVEVPSLVPAILGPALAFFIGFNNNQAYDRWWEARKIWGAIVNDSRTWTRQMIHYTSANSAEEINELKKMRQRTIYRHIAFLYALKENLRGNKDLSFKKFLTAKEYESVSKTSNIHNAILNEQSKDLEYIAKRGWIDGFRFIEMNKTLIKFCDHMGMSERIKNTIFPSTYIFYTKIFIWFLIVSITFVSTDLVDFWAIPIGVFVGYVFLITHQVGLTILNPFEPTPSGISLDQITRTIEINLLETLGEKEIPEPTQSVNNEYIM